MMSPNCDNCLSGLLCEVRNCAELVGVSGFKALRAVEKRFKNFLPKRHAGCQIAQICANVAGKNVDNIYTSSPGRALVISNLR